MILTKSPYYLDIPWEHPTEVDLPEKYIMQLFVWSGLKSNVPIDPVYELENKNPLGRTGNSSVNISNYINDFLEVSLESDVDINVIDANSAVWVKSQVIYYIDGVVQSAEYISIDLAIKGYAYGLEGKNYQINDNLTSVSRVNVSKNSSYNIALLLSETETTEVTVLSYPNNNINNTYNLAITTDSNEIVSNLFIDCSNLGNDTSIEIKRNDVLIKELTLKQELRFNPIDIWFVNKFGVLDTLVFFKDKEDSISIDSEEYESSVGQALEGFHQYQRYNTTAKKSFKINSGFVKESNNEIFTQLLLSDKVWQFKKGVFIPLNLKSKSLEYQTKNRDKLINYEISFDYAFNEVNNI